MVKEAAAPSTEQTSPGDRALAAVGNIAVKCPKCREILYGRDLEKNQKVCPRCSHHFRINARERIKLLVDEDSFVEIDADMIPSDPLHFVVSPPNQAKSLDYASKLVEGVIRVQEN